MEKQFNVSLCLEELHQSMKSLILEGKLYSILLAKFTPKEIEARLPEELANFVKTCEGAAADEAYRFCNEFCGDLIANQRLDYVQIGVDRMT
jgi:hypothetical protein